MNMHDPYDTDLQPKDNHRKKMIDIVIEECRSILRDVYYKATLYCSYDGARWEIIDRAETPWEATKKVWATYMGPYEDWSISGWKI